jgi:2-polyprenyl-6-methoxyphenol hydroxylase-like FAD-dependent oxidoreductase
MTESGGDVLIVDAGPGGLTLANDLAVRGVPFRVIDPLPAAMRESRAHGMLGRTLMALDKLGLAEPYWSEMPLMYSVRRLGMASIAPLKMR